MVFADPHSNAGLTDVTVAWHLRSNRPQERVVLLTLRISRANQSDINEGDQVLMVALMLKQDILTFT